MNSATSADDTKKRITGLVTVANGERRTPQMTNEEAIFDLEQFSFSPIGDGDLHRESVELALSALREQAERGKGCEFCLGEPMVYGKDRLKRTAEIYIDGNLLTADLYSESMAVAVCYCPMCGGKLQALR